MLILFGTRKVKIRTFTDEAVPCGNCGEYLMRDTTNGKSLYYFSKILEVESDSVYIQIGAYSYNRYTSRMDKDDYYVTDYFYGFHKDALKEWHSGGLVKKIKRSKKP